MKKVYFAAWMFFFNAALLAQTSNRIPGELLVQLKPEMPLNVFRANLRSLTFAQYGAPVAAGWHMHKLLVNEGAATRAKIIEAVLAMEGVQAAQWNYKVVQRNTEPDDAEWSNQYNMQIIGAPSAWDASTGGLTPNGDTIVVAVLEVNGTYYNHPDVIDNWWFNWKEIPEDMVDNDGNGYVDDFRGYNARFNNDSQGNNEVHGTFVNGVIGASGNNQIGVAGLNWNIKLLNVANTEAFDEIIEGYYYVANMRRLYNQTNGQKGAFVVATNSSFGRDFEFPDAAPMWCAAYDSLGAVGVVSVCATINQNVNVDEVGDLPTTCPSNYMIAVTSTTQNDVKASNAGYGPVNIDLGAPGDAVYSTRVVISGGMPTPTYGPGSGTSYATPLVSGAVGLLYSLDCSNFSADALTNPAATATRARDMILSSVEPNNNLNGITATGGRLNIASAVNNVRNLCGGVSGPLTILDIKGTFGRGPLAVQYQTPDFEPYQVRIFNMLGELVHEETVQPQQFSVNFYEFNYRNFPAGAYVFTLGRGSNWVTEKFLKI